ncbi:hypothetical protein HMPREF1531_01066 [Propionibacterium sp. oral taxon 192 str. F0372]|uniref:diacylglycerol/lipid kinase family protein n=1 Tax=Propionibacterium sp. oral taxon 192 TaxID=671222 RepID=UPI0003544220|nr:diacylglycerol kinase family protein [Propionibacterium sp. oral taxon 192]EPH05637.1 hypothetical protein HMPREF1531_01066 [Propionibacterium sp. oral taxon 192 str. F0372]
MERARRVGVVFNPTKTADPSQFAEEITHAITDNDDEVVAVYPTTRDDPGTGVTTELLRHGVDLVLAAGGDGTVRAVTSGLIDTQVPCGLVPLGTGNLMARNLGIPMDLTEAVEIALNAPHRPMDMVRLIIDHDTGHPTWFTGMAGVGFDAAMMRDTHEDLKKVIGSGAYVLAFAKHIATPPRKVRIQIDARSPVKRRSVLVMVGNTHSLKGGLVLFPDARPDDGQIDLVTATPYIPGAWARVLGVLLRSRYLRRRARAESRAVQFDAGRRITLSFDKPMPWEVDGDTIGTGKIFEFSVHPGVLHVVTPLHHLGLRDTTLLG